jgi:hypothetical protein
LLAQRRGATRGDISVVTVIQPAQSMKTAMRANAMPVT